MNRSFFQIALIILLVILLVLLAAIFVMVMVREGVEKCISELLGLSLKPEVQLSSKPEVLKFIGIGMGGVLIALQALMSYKRAKAMEDTAKAHADAVLNTEQGVRQERLKNGIEHLGHEKDSVRLSGAYELFHLAEDAQELRQTVFDILCAHIRQTTGESVYLKTHRSKLSEEVQSLLTLLFVQEHDVFKDFHINLQGSYLNLANLREARLEKAVLTNAHLQGADLRRVQLQDARLREAHLQGASLAWAHLQEASLAGAHLQEASLLLAQLQEADLRRAQLQEAYLVGAHLQEAYLLLAQLQGASLAGAQLQGAGSIWKADGTFEERIRESIGKATDKSGVYFEGGLSSERVDDIVEGLPDERAKVLREKLEPHIGKPLSDQLPNGAITGTYSKEEAEKWIAEYQEAMSAVPTQNENT